MNERLDWDPGGVALRLAATLLLTAIAVQAAPFAYIPNANSNNVSVIDTATNVVVATVAVGFLPRGSAVNPGGAFAYIANSTGNSLSVLDTATNTVVTTVPVGVGALGVAVNPVGSRVYVTNQTANTISVLDTATNTVLTTIPTGAAPTGIAATPRAHWPTRRQLLPIP